MPFGGRLVIGGVVRHGESVQRRVPLDDVLDACGSERGVQDL